MGVTMFVLALAHGTFSIIQFHALGNVNPLVSLLVSNTRFASLRRFSVPVARASSRYSSYFLMAATSHDFWLHNLSAPVWKRLHMLVYLAYALLIAHVTLGALQSETSPVLAAVLAAGSDGRQRAALLAAVSRAPQGPGAPGAGRRGIRGRVRRGAAYRRSAPAWSRAEASVSPSSNTMAAYRPSPTSAGTRTDLLGEGKIIDGCITCPWHGYQYLPESGASPPPFTEKVATYRTTRDWRASLRPSQRRLPPGTRVEPSVIEHDTTSLNSSWAICPCPPA